MKNLHLLPTDKPSRYVTNYMEQNMQWQNIYITSDEEIKEGDYVINNLDKLIGKSIRELNSGEIKDREYSKIILTTDQDLINDGVQAIDDDFLEWFIKNPSYESVKWNAYPISPNGNIVATNRPYPFEGLISNFKIEYKIIIPKEEPKQFTTEILIDLKQGLDNAIQKSNPLFPNFDYLNKIKNKETLEEAAERILANNVDGLSELLQDDDLFFFYKGVIQCYGEAMAEWQAEIMYSKTIEFAEWCDDMGYTQVTNSFWKSLNDEKGKTTKELFEQFKNKTQ